MGRGPSGNPAFLVVAAVLLVVVAVGAISRANRRQRPVLWSGLALILLMIVVPPWVGEKGEWVNVAAESGRYEPEYLRYPVSMGYAPVWHSPAPRHFNTWTPMSIDWPRLAGQCGAVILVTGFVVGSLKRRPPKNQNTAAPVKHYPL